MGAEAKGNLLALFAVDAKGIGVGIDRFVTIGRRVPKNHRLASLDLLTAYFGVRGRGTHEVTHWRNPANHLIDGRRHQAFRVCAKRAHLLRVLNQPEQAASG